MAQQVPIAGQPGALVADPASLCPTCLVPIGGHQCPAGGTAGAPGALTAVVLTAGGKVVYAGTRPACGKCGGKAHRNEAHYHAQRFPCLWRIYSAEVLQLTLIDPRVAALDLTSYHVEKFGMWLDSWYCLCGAHLGGPGVAASPVWPPVCAACVRTQRQATRRAAKAAQTGSLASLGASLSSLAPSSPPASKAGPGTNRPINPGLKVWASNVVCKACDLAPSAAEIAAIHADGVQLCTACRAAAMAASAVPAPRLNPIDAGARAVVDGIEAFEAAEAASADNVPSTPAPRSAVNPALLVAGEDDDE